MIFIGIDTGTHTGLAVWDSTAKELLVLKTLSITQAMAEVRETSEFFKAYGTEVRLYIEDARQRKWFGHTGRERLKGAGSVCRDARIWQDWCREQGLVCEMVAPHRNRTKLSDAQFRWLTGWCGRTSEHARDAAMLVYGK